MRLNFTAIVYMHVCLCIVNGSNFLDIKNLPNELTE